MSNNDKKISMTYWYGLVIPLVVSILILATVVVFITVKVGEPHHLFRKASFQAVKPPIY